MGTTGIPALAILLFVQVTGYGENGTGDANDVWRVEVEGAKEGDPVLTVVSKYVNVGARQN